jgi:5-methylcytosine-specific restriction endonuclease McrA
MMAFHPRDYHPQWQDVRRQILDQADHCCEFCGVKNGAQGARDRSGAWHDWPKDESYNSTDGSALFGEDGCPEPIRIVLTIAHLCWETCQDKRCTEPTHLRALCQRCHLNWDRRHHLAVQAANRALRKQQAFAATGQLAMDLVP